MSQNREPIRSLYDAFAEGDAATVLGALHPEARWVEAENSPYADRNPYVGPQQVGEGLFARLMADFPDFTVTPANLVAEGEKVVSMGRYRGTCDATGEPLDAQFVHVWTVEDGAVTGFQQYTDTAQWGRVMGAA